MAAGGARAVFDEFAALPAEPPDVAPWLARLAASTGASDPFGEQGVEGARVFALALDAADPLSAMRHQFHIPKARDDAATDSVYLTGHSLGLQPVSTAAAVQAELDKWAARGVAGHFEGDLPWASCEEKLVDLLGELVGARNPQLEVAGMNSLTVNLHFLMAAFYRPVAGRAGILIEAGAFPSDRYAVASQIAHHGFDPAEWMVEVQPDQGTGLLTTEAITEAIARHEGRLALVLLGGVNYLTGQARHRHRRKIALTFKLLRPALSAAFRTGCARAGIHSSAGQVCPASGEAFSQLPPPHRRPRLECLFSGPRDAADRQLRGRAQRDAPLPLG